MITEYFFDDRESFIDALTEECTSRLQDAITERGEASLLASGGSTPQALYRQLSHTDLPWSSVSVALVDERWVDPGQPGSNETFVKQNLLQERAASARYVPTKTPHAYAAEALPHCEQAYSRLPRPFDLTILGMGPDGHTASLFPHADGLAEALDPGSEKLCAAITAQQSEVTGELTERLSLSLYGLLQSRQLHLLITGEEKLAVYQTARDNQDIFSTPVSAVLRQSRIPVLVYWAP